MDKGNQEKRASYKPREERIEWFGVSPAERENLWKLQSASLNSFLI